MSSFNTDLVGAVREIRDSMKGTKEIRIVPQSCALASTGGPLAVFADSANNPSVAGIQLTNSKVASVRWNNAATFTGILASVAIPYDLDPTMPITVLASVSKVGATAADVTSLTIAAYLAKTGQLHDADADFGGASSAVPAATATKTVVTLTRTLAASDVTAQLGSAPLGSTESATLTLSIAPTAGTLGTDDFCLHGITLRYTSRYPSA